MTHSQVLLLRARVDLGVRTMKGHSRFPKAPELLEPHHQIFSAISWTLDGGAGFLPIRREAVGVFFSPYRLGKYAIVCMYICMYECIYVLCVCLSVSEDHMNNPVFFTWPAAYWILMSKYFKRIFHICFLLNKILMLWYKVQNVFNLINDRKDSVKSNIREPWGHYEWQNGTVKYVIFTKDIKTEALLWNLSISKTIA